MAWEHLPDGVASCDNCRFRTNRPQLVCSAFPGGIPPQILFGGFDHREEFPGDKGIRWQPNERLLAIIVEQERRDRDNPGRNDA